MFKCPNDAVCAGATTHEAKPNEALKDPSCWRPQEFVADEDRDDDDGEEEDGKGKEHACPLDLTCETGSTAVLCGTCDEDRIFATQTMTCVNCKGYAEERVALYLFGVYAIFLLVVLNAMFSSERLKIWKHTIFVKLLEP